MEQRVRDKEESVPECEENFGVIKRPVIKMFKNHDSLG